MASKLEVWMNAQHVEKPRFFALSRPVVGEEGESFTEAVRLRWVGGAVGPNARGDGVSKVYGMALKG